MQYTDDRAFARLEAAYGAYQEAWGAWMVGHPGGPSPDRDAELAAALVDARRAVAAELGVEAWGPLSTTDRAGLGNIRGALPDLDAWAAPLDGLARDETAPGEPPDIAALRRVTFDAWVAAMADLEVGDERLDRLTVSARLAREEDPAARRRLFLAMEPGWRAVNGDYEPDSPYRRLLGSSAARWAAEGSPIEA